MDDERSAKGEEKRFGTALASRSGIHGKPPTLEEQYRQYRQDPVLWAERELGVELWSRQKEILYSVFQHRRTVVPSGHGVGKTFVSAVAALAFLMLRKPAKVITTAPTWLQVKRLLWGEINTLFKTRLLPRTWPGTLLMTQLRVRDDWFALGISPKESVSFQGFHQQHVLIVLDEAPGVRREIYEGADSLMSGGDAHMLMIGNPTAPQGHFYEACRSEGWNVVRLSCLDSPNFTEEPVSQAVRSRLVTKEWVEEKAQEWGRDSAPYVGRVLGQFPVAGDDVLIPLAWVEQAIRRVFSKPVESQKYLGVDVARYGDDATVYALVEGDRVVELFAEYQRDTMHIVGRIRQLCADEDVAVVAVDDVGVGGGVTDRLLELDVPVRGVNVGEPAIERERFVNRRTELWWVLREWVRTTAVLPRHPRLIEDLTAPKFSYTSKGQIQLERKEETKKRLGRSPDFGDALMLALAARVAMTQESFGWDGILGVERAFPV